MSEQKVKFYELLDMYCSEQKKTCVITQDLYDKVLNAIHLDSRTKCDDGAKFKHWCKNQFKVETWCKESSVLQQDLATCYN